MLHRVLEPEVMDTHEEALAYDAMDHSEVNRAFVDDLLAAADAAGVSLECEILDLGTGTAQIPVELCGRDERYRVLAVDLSTAMLDLGRAGVEVAGLTGQIMLERVDAKSLPYADGRFGCVMSNSIVHHIPEPAAVLREAWRVLASGGLLFVRDLLRPEDAPTLSHLVATYAGDATDHQRQLFADSLQAALRVEEMQTLVGQLGADENDVRQTTDRHWTWATRKP